METKKVKKADLENKKGLFLQIGLVLSLSCVLFAFEWKSYESANVENIPTTIQWEDEDILLNFRVPPPPPPPAKHLPTEVQVVTDDVDIDDPIDLNDIPTDDAPALPYEMPSVTIEDPTEDETIWDIADVHPSFEGGDAGFLNFLQSNIKYPVMAMETGIQGTVYIGFVVEKDGSISQAHVIRSIGGGCDEEALRVINMMPKWKPGSVGTNSVRVKFTVPVRFQLK